MNLLLEVINRSENDVEKQSRNKKWQSLLVR